MLLGKVLHEMSILTILSHKYFMKKILLFVKIFLWSSYFVEKILKKMAAMTTNCYALNRQILKMLYHLNSVLANIPLNG